jgi:hypothetical protein
MPILGTLPTLSVEDLMTRGYFPDRVIPPINSLGLSPALPDILAYVRPKAQDIVKKVKGAPSFPRSHYVSHSVPKRKHLRRSFSIPNPLNQCVLADEIASHWPELKTFCEQSPIALSIPELGAKRALESSHGLSEQSFHRARQSVGCRYLLKTDIARFYPSIYTHSIPWALHTKSAARADTKYVLTGNRIDLWTRETQDRQTGGIPIGPDTSFLIGEVLGTALDLRLQARLGVVRGIRFIDDYYLYFRSVAEAEKGLTVLHEISREYELEINDPKTEIVQLPETLEPAWKSDLRILDIRDSGQPQQTDLLTLFDRAFHHAEAFPYDSVLTYAARQVLSATITGENWAFCEALLLKAALAEPTMLSVLVDIYEKYSSFHTSNEQLTSAIEAICAYHAPLQQGNEVAWALWLAKKMSVTISKPIADRIAKLDDDVVALVALDLHASGLLQATGFPKWRAFMTAGNLFDSHWLLAYEAFEQGWLIPRADYIATNEFFSILRQHAVRFYSDGLAPTASYFDYSDDSDEEADESDETPEITI